MADADMDMRKEAMGASSSSPPPPFVRPRRGVTLPRARTPLGLWFWEFDRVLLLLITILICIGLLAVAAPSPVASPTPEERPVGNECVRTCRAWLCSDHYTQQQNPHHII